MRSAKLYFNGTLFRKNLARFWPVWVLYSVCWFFALVAPPLLNTRDWTRLQANRLPLQLIGGAGMLAALVFSLMAVMCVFSYLYSSRPVNLMHALPIRREGLFLTNYLSGLAFLILPNLGLFLLGLGSQALAGAMHVGSLCMWLMAQCLLCLFFYSFAVFCAMFTGHLLALPVFYGVLNGLVAGLVYLFNGLAREFLYGFAGVDGLYTVARWFTPVWNIADNMYVRTNYVNDFTEKPIAASYTFEGLHIILFYAVVGLVLAALALLAYRRRHLERAGDIVSVGWVRPVFKYGVAVCTSVVLGTFTYSLLFYSGGRPGWVLLVLMILWGAFGYFVAEMLLCKSFWVFKKSWKGCMVLLVLLLAAAVVLALDLTGYERRLPKEEQVASVRLSGLGSAPYDEMNYLYLTVTDPGEIAELLAIHQTVIGEKDLLAYHQRNTLNGPQETRESGTGLYVQEFATETLELSYTMKNGSIMTRKYLVAVTPELLSDPTSGAAQITAYLNSPALAQQVYFENWAPTHKLVSARINAVELARGDYGELLVDSRGMEPLLQAVQSDIRAGNLGRRYLLDSLERLENSYLSDLNLTFYVPEGAEPPADGSQVIHYDSDTRTYNITISLQVSATETLAVLRQYSDLGGQFKLTTHAEEQTRSYSEKYGDMELVPAGAAG